MSLDFNGWGNWAGEESDFFDPETDQMRPETESVIFHTMFVGINSITEQTVDEFWNRSLLFARIHGNEPFFKRDLVTKMVGLHTNASPFTRAAFNKAMLQHYWGTR